MEETTKVTKIFLSQPMNGKTDEEIFFERAKILKLVKEKYGNDADLLDTFIDESYDEKHPGLRYLAKSIDWLDAADAIVMASGWEDARGCRIEHACAAAYGIPILYFQGLRSTLEDADGV